MDRRNATIIFIVIAAVFAVGSIFLFTPNAGNQSSGGATAMWVNDQPVDELELSQLQSSIPIMGLRTGGAVDVLIDTFFIDVVAQQALLEQAAAKVSVPSSEVNAMVDQIRQQYGVTEKEAYSQFLTQQGLTDTRLRENIRNNLKIQKLLDEVAKDVEITPEEVDLYFQLHQNEYAGEEQVKARWIVTADAEQASQLRERAAAGEDFAALAKEFSSENAEQGGALGAIPGSQTPGPVSRLVFPEAVADAVFGLRGAGLTPVVEAGGKQYLVSIEEFLPGTEVEFESVKEQVESDVLQAKKDQVQESYLLGLTKDINLRFSDTFSYSYQNPIVAKAGDEEIKLAEVSREVFSSPQTLQIMQQGLGSLTTQFFFPQATDRMIEVLLVRQEADRSGLPFVGTSRQRADSMLRYQTRDITISDAEVEEFYQTNQQRFVEPATAKVTALVAKDKALADQARSALLTGQSPSQVSEALEGLELQNYGQVQSGDLPPVLSRLIFEAQPPLAESADGGISDVLEMEDGSFQVVLVKDQTDARTVPLEEIRAEVEQLALAQKRTEASQTYVQDLRAKSTVENNLETALAQITPPEPEPTEAPQGEAAPDGPATEAAPSPAESPASPAESSASPAESPASPSDSAPSPAESSASPAESSASPSSAPEPAAPTDATPAPDSGAPAPTAEPTN